MTRYQKITLLIGTLVLVALVVTIGVLVTSNNFNDCCAEPNQALPMYTDFNLTGTAAVLTPGILVGTVSDGVIGTATASVSD